MYGKVRKIDWRVSKLVIAHNNKAQQQLEVKYFMGTKKLKTKNNQR